MASESRKLDYDTLLVDHLGPIGKFQWRLLGLLSILGIFTVCLTNNYIFTTSRISSRCFIPECDNASNPEYGPTWILNAIPGTDANSLEDCTRYVSNASVSISNTTDYCSQASFDKTVTEECTSGNVYASTETIVYDFDLGCEEWKRSSVGTYKNIGIFIAMPLMGIIGDRFGRRTLLIFNIFNSCWIGLSKYWVQSYTVFVIVEVLESFVVSGCFQCIFVLALEAVGPKYRDIVSTVLVTNSSTSGIFLAILAWAVPNWRNLTLVVYTPQVIIIAYYWLIPESTRWLLSNARYDEAINYMKQVAKTNGKKPPDAVLNQLQNELENEKKLKEADVNENNPSLIALVFKERSLLKRCVLVPIWWITMTLVYHGLNINSVNLSGNKYVNNIIIHIVETPGFWTAWLLLKKFGRRPVLAVSYLVCAVCQITHIFVSSDYTTISQILYFFGKYVISLVAMVLYTYTAELFPTKYRQRLFSYSSMMGRLGSILAPLTPALSATIWTELPFALYGGFCLLSSCLMFFTPETRGTHLPESFQDSDKAKHNYETEKQ